MSKPQIKTADHESAVFVCGLQFQKMGLAAFQTHGKKARRQEGKKARRQEGKRLGSLY
ncbi:hypothetical protein [Endozoicomonas sp. ISHI1]|uniref:hypothetical protein n=1 Tax=Endozoicomonas sp. ISHI1 TaxID=2825882 RepID=UPI0021497A12|nr:hypothetical protein [Endozoicomonas sp. ISHI1]